MDRVEFPTVVQELGLASCPSVLPHVNGQPLTQLLRRAGRPATGGPPDRTLPGGHAGLVADGIRWPSLHYLGEPVLGSFDDDTALLGCGCGDYGCGPFSAVVTVEDDVVVWSSYRFADRWTFFTDLRDLVFGRRQYEAAVRSTAEGDAGPYRSGGRRRR